MKFFPLLLSLCSLMAAAQTSVPGIKTGIDSSSLLSTDNRNNNRYYKELPIQLKKGMGAVFYMESNAFKPYLIFFSTGDGKSFGVPHITKEKNGDRITISFTAPADTSFFLIFSSYEETVTGKFYYGYSILDSAQMAFSNDFTLCQRLHYLLNQWQANWELLPTTTGHHIDSEDPEMSYDYRMTSNTLIRGANTEIDARYKEVLFSTKEYGANDDFYKKICKDIMACLDASQWESQSVVEEEKISVYSNETRGKIVTHFYIKGAKGLPFKSFDVILNIDFTNILLKPYEVHLVFN